MVILYFGLSLRVFILPVKPEKRIWHVCCFLDAVPCETLNMKVGCSSYCEPVFGLNFRVLFLPEKNSPGEGAERVRVRCDKCDSKCSNLFVTRVNGSPVVFGLLPRKLKS